MNAAACLGTCPETVGFLTLPAPLLCGRVHVSENTAVGWLAFCGHTPRRDGLDRGTSTASLWNNSDIDGTPFDVVTDADIVSGKLLLDAVTPRYAIMFSLANHWISEICCPAGRVIRSSRRSCLCWFKGSWTRNESKRQFRCSLSYLPGHVGVSAENSFSTEHNAGNTIDANCDNLWIK